MTRKFGAVKHVLALAGVLVLFGCTATPATREKVLRIVPQSDLLILDPGRRLVSHTTMPT